MALPRPIKILPWLWTAPELAGPWDGEQPQSPSHRHPLPSHRGKQRIAGRLRGRSGHERTSAGAGTLAEGRAWTLRRHSRICGSSRPLPWPLKRRARRHRPARTIRLYRAGEGACTPGCAGGVPFRCGWRCLRRWSAFSGRVAGGGGRAAVSGKKDGGGPDRRGRRRPVQAPWSGCFGAIRTRPWRICANSGA